MESIALLVPCVFAGAVTDRLMPVAPSRQTLVDVIFVMRTIAFVCDTASVTRILEHIGEPTIAPVLSAARGPPAWETFDQTPVFEPVAPAPAPAFEFDQSVTW